MKASEIQIKSKEGEGEGKDLGKEQKKQKPPFIPAKDDTKPVLRDPILRSDPIETEEAFLRLPPFSFVGAKPKFKSSVRELCGGTFLVILKTSNGHIYMENGQGGKFIVAEVGLGKGRHAVPMLFRLLKVDKGGDMSFNTPKGTFKVFRNMDNVVSVK